MKKKYDETYLKKRDFPDYPDYIVLPISKLKSFNINIDKTESKIKISLLNIKDSLNEDYLIVFQNIGTNEKPIYKELITKIDFWLAFGDVYEKLETVKFILDLAKKIH